MNIQNRLAGLLQRVRSADQYVRTLYVFNTISLVGGTMYGLYYGVFLYRHTFSLSVLAIDGLLGGFGLWLGYVLGAYIIRRFGYGVTYRTAFALWTAIALATSLLTNHIADIFMILAVLKALPSGMYNVASDTVMLREIKTGVRSGFFQIKLALEFVATIVLPPLVGALIAYSGGYTWAFVASAAVYAGGLFVRLRLPRPAVSIAWRDMLTTIRRPYYVHHALNRTLANGFNQLNGFAYTIIPFLLLRNELSMGLLTSAISLVAVLVALGARRIKQQHGLRVSYGAYSVRALASLLFVNSWTAPLMVAWQLVGKVMTPLHDPMQQSLDIQNDGLVLGKDMQRQALQINVLNNTLALLGTTVAFGAFLFIMHAGAEQQRNILQALIVVYASWRFVNLTASKLINRWVQAPHYTPVWLRLGMRLSYWHSRLGAHTSRLSMALLPIR